MKKVIYTDENGFNHNSLLRDSDTDPAAGLLQSPPDLRQLDWDEITRIIHNKLLERGLLTIKDVQIRNNEFNQIILASVGKKIFALYQQETNQ